MELILAGIAGGLCKVYDDFNDNGFLTNELYKELLKGSQWILLTVLSIRDFNFAFVNYMINGLNAIANWKEWNFPYESSLLILAPFVVILSYPTRSSVSYYDIFYILFFMTCMFIEPFIIKEEFSLRKLIIRSIAVVYSCIGVYGGIYFGVSTSFIKISAYAIGYFICSSIFQAYMIYNDIPKTS